MLLVVEQFLNGLQFGLLLFLLAAGLTLVFGIMDFVNLAHGSLYMMGAYFAATFVAWTGNFILGIVLALGATLLLGIVLEFVALRHLYGRDHLDHVLIEERVVDVFAGPPVPHDPLGAQDAELLRDCGQRGARSLCELRDTPFSLRQASEEPQARGIESHTVTRELSVPCAGCIGRRT